MRAPSINLTLLVWAGLALTALGLARGDEADILIADFEGQDYGNWVASGDAFGSGPARGTLPNQMEVSGFEGRGLVNSYHGGDGSTGTLTSPEFTIERKYINFLIGGGQYPGEACINLLVDGQVARTATGPNDRPGGSERLDWHCWDVSNLLGKSAVIQIVDRRTGGWGHINVDQIVQSQQKREVGPASRQLAVAQRYLHFPVKNGAQPVRVKVSVGDSVVDEFDMELAAAEPDFWVFLDMDRYRGKTATIDVDALATGSQGLAQIRQAEQVPGADTLYQEKYRPQFHFSPRVGWNNDPNGLVYYRGEWHLFFQHNPYGWKWGNMHWGHAVSQDLVHWNELPIAIYPHRYGDWVFSGGAVVDTQNTAGFKSGDDDTLVASYTSTGRGESLAYSNDRGRTFTEYEGNPVVKHQGRDPKIIWYAPGHHWVMAVYDEQQDGDKLRRQIAFYSSPNLRDWTRQSTLEGYFECPEIFPLAVDADVSRKRWVVYAADGAYAIGSFDGRTFTPDHEGKHRFNWGNCFYASQTFSNVPPTDGRRIQIAWGQIGHASMPFNQQMNFPVELTLRTTDEGPRLFAEPVKEIELLHAGTLTIENEDLDEGSNPLADFRAELIHLQTDIEVGTARQIVLTVRGVPIKYDVAAQTLQCLNSSAPLKVVDGHVRLELLVDRLSIEIYGNAGRIYMPMGSVLDVGNREIQVSAQGGRARIRTMKVHTLKSAWTGTAH